MRLNRFLSLCGLGSRRGCEEVIREGRVALNDKRVTELATVVETGDRVTVDGRAVHAKKGTVIILHKPKGYLCTRGDPQGRPTIYDLLPARFQTLHHVGRLDQDSEGLILLTNRGELSQRLAHPSEGIEKEYEVRVETEFNHEHLAKLVAGVMTPEGFARAERAWMENAWLVHVVLKQGLKRQIRHMFYILGYEVERLTRTRIGGQLLKGLPKGGWKELTEAEVERNFEKRTAKPRSVVKPFKKSAPGADEGDDFFAPVSESAAKPRSSKKQGFDHEAPAPKGRGRGKPDGRRGAKGKPAARRSDDKRPPSRGLGKGKPAKPSKREYGDSPPPPVQVFGKAWSKSEREEKGGGRSAGRSFGRSASSSPKREGVNKPSRQGQRSKFTEKRNSRSGKPSGGRRGGRSGR